MKTTFRSEKNIEIRRHTLGCSGFDKESLRQFKLPNIESWPENELIPQFDARNLQSIVRATLDFATNSYKKYSQDV